MAGQENFQPKCKFCQGPVFWGPGMMMVEEFGGKGFICHEECYQQSGEDEGYISRLYESLEGHDGESE